jgi:hypothetical protein
MAEKLQFVLYYYKTYPTFDVLAWMFHKQEHGTFSSELCPCRAVLTALAVDFDP